ncbi:DEKNAAC100680 [Brettanomyces naardenensis]|uniref:DEKNAAC100680 n=1 Tax=Brettanomyces naardenensis TaxID=13370 RepID=A0A448YEH5_BRENA|nr:DEKNAAC100680 [Brettanomyces naardenensis]
MITNRATCIKVRTNLVHYNLWSDVSLVEFEEETLHEKLMLLKGKNPKSEEENSNGYDYVLPVLKQTKLTLQDIDLIFQHLTEMEGYEVGKIVLGIMDFDGTVVYYNIHPGVQKPKNS